MTSLPACVRRWSISPTATTGTRDDERRALVDDLFAKYDTTDEREGPRYRCLRCRDTGFVSYEDHKRRSMVGHCVCQQGLSVRDEFKFKLSGNRIGGADTEFDPTDNDFNNTEFL